MSVRRWLLSAALLACGGCGGESGEAIDEHRQEWLAKQPQQYVVEICGTGLGCCCEVSAVSAGEVVAARRGFRGGTPMDVTPGSEEPITALFGRVSRALHANDCDLQSLAFDADYSYLSDYYFDCGQEGSGEKVECFAPNTVDLSACAE